eukprot:158924-Chlamydomonas_euryale.AAC.1
MSSTAGRTPLCGKALPAVAKACAGPQHRLGLRPLETGCGGDNTRVFERPCGLPYCSKRRAPASPTVPPWRADARASLQPTAHPFSQPSARFPPAVAPAPHG